jgi:uncharacterized membrane protein YedE/YeeE
MTDAGFSPVSGLEGGALVGAASALLLLANGRIAGISGILGSSVRAARGDRCWRASFLVGLPVGAWLAVQAGLADPAFVISSSPGRLVAGGLLVGIGTQLGSGCTSGHGVCGIARGSRRSIAATAVFMATAAATVFLTRHVLGVL